MIMPVALCGRYPFFAFSYLKIPYNRVEGYSFSSIGGTAAASARGKPRRHKQAASKTLIVLFLDFPPFSYFAL